MSESKLIETISDYELERGKPMPSKNHAIIQKNILSLFILEFMTQFEALPELSLKMKGQNRVPDIAIYKSMEFIPNEDEIKVSEVPLCAIEILSPTQNTTELTSKCGEYFDFGVKSYWLVIPDLQAIFVFRNATEHEVFANKEMLEDKQLGIQLDLGAVFSRNFNQYRKDKNKT